jgi:hypothetical protein
MLGKLDHACILDLVGLGMKRMKTNIKTPLMFPFLHFITGNKTKSGIVRNENGRGINKSTKTNGNGNIKQKLAV